ncbi:acetyl-CoA carboxylase, carboxyltransferase subunit beta [Calditerrivibrio nitroreducens]|uniref:Acetyl-coenzyme A carboxylase carboxyl transferase subunit beta n=1 Tax=Calditerrivibrio nitroreducens (strain DSM 19672 / NBRC 101217 / Yu37-1) TaxID=768670 RepID=E4TIE1_CALNY|nr:acetyl-CoA carboxylase, carboxyltransferase subunit beta [Calditerrivibrio nitroreducens]ADR17966.1 acetyl-CoA carboxylase carboxyltransferase subunit alpha [Calditerrivibrio nitroreducens DSM 19672]
MGLRSFLLEKIQKVTETKKKEIQKDIWVKCEKCGEVSYKDDIINNFHTCPACGYHFKVGAMDKINMIVDAGSFVEMDANLKSLDPLQFKDTKKYIDRIRDTVKKTSINEAFISGYGTVYKKPVHIGAFEFSFLGGSMGSVVGEKITRLIESAIANRNHVITISCSGGARMQESILSLMQMAKTSAALKKLSNEGLAHISILTDPTTGGVTASFAMLGDVHIAEPRALIGFAGPRVIEQTIRQKLPEGFQTAEFLLQHGMVDMVLHRKEWKDTIYKLLQFFG